MLSWFCHSYTGEQLVPNTPCSSATYTTPSRPTRQAIDTSTGDADAADTPRRTCHRKPRQLPERLTSEEDQESQDNSQIDLFSGNDIFGWTETWYYKMKKYSMSWTFESRQYDLTIGEARPYDSSWITAVMKLIASRFGWIYIFTPKFCLNVDYLPPSWLITWK